MGLCWDAEGHVHFRLHGLLCARSLVLVGLDHEHVEVADDGAEVCCAVVSCAIFLTRLTSIPSTSLSVAAAIVVVFMALGQYGKKWCCCCGSGMTSSFTCLPRQPHVALLPSLRLDPLVIYFSPLDDVSLKVRSNTIVWMNIT